jgi:predicted permease
MTRTERIVRLVLRLYPSGFRERYGEGVATGVLDVVERAKAGGRIAVATTWVGAIVDVLVGLLRERWRGDSSAWRRARFNERGGRETMGAWYRDVRYALRVLVGQPLFTLVAAGSLAIGIGANTAVFSVANALLLRPLAGIENYERVVELGRSRDGSGFDSFAYPDFVDIREQVPALEIAVPYTLETLSVSRSAEGVRAAGLHVGARYFELLGVAPGLGRYFVPEEDEGFDIHPVTVVSHHFWAERLAADPDVIGSTLYLNRHAYEIVGVTPESFDGHMVGLVPDIYMPMTQLPMMSGGREDFEARNSVWHLALGLLAEGATLDELNRQLTDLGARLAAAYPDSNARRGFRALPLGPVPGAGRGGVRLFVTALLGMVVLILLVTCTNVAGMFLARAASRQREVAVRLALGASRGDLVQQLTVEALAVFLLGGGLGVALGVWAVGFLRPELFPLPVPIRFSVSPDTTVILVSAAITLATGLLFGLLPALRATRMDVVGSMKQEGPGGSRRSSAMRRIFAGSQVGLSLVLLVTAGLFVRSLQRASSIDTGFDPEGAYVSYLDLSLEGYDEAAGRVFQESLLASLRGRSWVRAASISTDLPLDLSSSGTGVTPDGWQSDDPYLPVDLNRVSDGYFETLAIPVLAGRGFTSADREETEAVVVVSETFARLAWPGEDPLGRTLVLGRADPDAPRSAVVGVVADVKNQIINEAPKAFMYVPLAQAYQPGVQVVVRSSLAPGEAIEALRAALTEADPMASRGAIGRLDDFTAIGILPQRIAAGLTATLALLALLLSGLGIYGVVSFAVGRRKREIGIRMALGADRRSVIRRVMRGGLMLAIPGLVVGGAVSIVVANLLRALLLDLSPYDPVALGTVSLMLLTVVIIASGIPARRAARVDPADSLRSE